MSNNEMVSVRRELLQYIDDGGYCKTEVMDELRGLLAAPESLPDRYADQAYCKALEEERDYLIEQLDDRLRRNP